MASPEIALLLELVLDLKKDQNEIRKDVSTTKEMTFENSVVLAEHARRSLASETRLDVQEEKLEGFIEAMKPVEEHVRSVAWLTRVGFTGIKLAGTLLSVYETVKTILKFR